VALKKIHISSNIVDSAAVVLVRLLDFKLSNSNLLTLCFGVHQGGDGVVECVHEESGRSNSVSAYKSWNVPNRKQNRRVEDLSGVNLESASIIDGAIYCKVVVDPVLKVEDSTYDLDNSDYFVLLAAGASLKSTKTLAK